ncbi:MAG: hypothetical protein ACYCPQ_07655 [Elusimicrobiota bacterium]
MMRQKYFGKSGGINHVDTRTAQKNILTEQIQVILSAQRAEKPAGLRIGKIRRRRTLMKMNDDPFDKKLDLWQGRIPREIHDSAVFVNDTLKLCWASAQSVFEKNATPEHALAIYDRIVARAKQGGEILPSKLDGV